MTRRSLILVAVFLACGRGPVSGQVPPDADWRTTDTEHFRITFPAPLADLAVRAGEKAEGAYRALERSFARAPEGKIELVLTDHVDLTNGFADLTPWKRITVFARPPVDGFALIYYDDWLQLVITHELAHVFHLDLTGTLGGAMRAVFGRLPASWPVFPERSLPTWAVEGLATYYESALTGSGRVQGTFHEMMLRTAILEDAFETLDEASGESPVWPAGDRPYLYGSRFFEYLAGPGHPERVEEFAEAVAGQIVPFRLDAAGREAFGVSLSRAWSEWTDSLEARYSALADTLRRRRPLTRREPVGIAGRLALHARVSPTGERVAWSRSDGVTDVQIRVARPDGSGSRKLVRTNGTGVLSWTPGGAIVFDQLEFEDPYRIRRDLYVASLDDGVRRITRNARVSQADVHPDGRRAVAVQDGGGTNRLVVVELEDGRIRPLTPFEPGVQWSFPRWSPDGRWLAVGRWERGAYYDVVILDGQGREALRLTRDRAVDQAPTWSPDGRRVLWSSDRTGIPNLFAVEVRPERGERGPLRQVTNLLTGAWYPSVDPQGRWIHLSVYHADGWHVERIPYDPDRWFDPFPTDPRFLEGEATASPAGADGPSETPPPEVPETPAGHDYSPFPSLYPTYWQPVFEPAQAIGDRDVVGAMIGAEIGGQDVVGRHGYSAWLRVEADADPRVEASAAYSWAGLGNPILGLSASQLYDARGRVEAEIRDPSGVTDTVALYLTRRERELGASVSFLRNRVRSFSSASVSSSWIRQDRSFSSDDPVADTLFRPAVPRSDLLEGALTLVYANTRTHPFSVSREDGIAGFVRFRGRLDPGLADSLSGSPGWDPAFVEASGRIQLFKGIAGPGFGHHVLALRMTGGTASGPGADRFHFDVGGASGRSETLTGFGLFGGPSLLFPVRGYPRAYRSGRHAWTASLEYRVPLALVHRGLGSAPLYLDRLSAALFLDGGNAWGPDLDFRGVPNRRRAALASVGAEILASTLPFWATLVDVRVGAAFPLVELGDPGVYLRLGWSF